MRRFTLTSIVFFLSINVANLAFGQKNGTIIKEIESLMKQQEKAWNNFDIDGFMKHYWNNDSLMFVGKTVTYGWKQTYENYRKNYSSKELMGVLTFTNIKMDVLSKSSVAVVGKWKITRSDSSQIGGHYSLLWKKINGKWLIVRDHTS